MRFEMITKIILLLFATALLGTTQAFAQPDIIRAADSLFCSDAIETTKRTRTCTWTWYFDTPIDAENPITFIQDDDETYEEFIIRIFDRIAILTPELETDPSEPVLSPAIQEALDKKIAEIAKEDEELAKAMIDCSYGLFGFKAFQDLETFESIERLYQKLFASDYKKLTLNMAYEACRGMLENKEQHTQYEDYPGVDDEPAPWKPTATVYDHFETIADKETWNTRHLTARDRLEALEDAIDLPKDWRDPYIGCIPIDDADKRCESRGSQPIGKDCQFNPSTQTVDLCPNKALAKYEAQEKRTFATATKVLCDMYYKVTEKGRTSPILWPEILVDGTCDNLIDGLEKARGDYIREQWKGQTAKNCPDCSRFQ